MRIRIYISVIFILIQKSTSEGKRILFYKYRINIILLCISLKCYYLLHFNNKYWIDYIYYLLFKIFIRKILEIFILL